jgi:RNase P/RNase MRP subunit POP5
MLFYKELGRMIGEMNYNRVNPRITKGLSATTFVMRVDNDGLAQAVRALALMRQLDRQETAFYTLLSSGTIKALEKGYRRLTAAGS